MENISLTPLQIREVFHLEFLRWFNRKVDIKSYALKGGCNLRFFFGSRRYSEDMDLDVRGIMVDRIKKVVMEIFLSRGFVDSIRSFGIEKVVPPNISKSKQTETTQRFKVHLLTMSGEDLFTKIEFSRRRIEYAAVVEQVSSQILRFYKMPPLLVSHYDVNSAVGQKIQALAQRSILQARDIFDLFVLNSQYEASRQKSIKIDNAALKTAYNNIFQVEFPQFRDTVVAYLQAEDQKIYSSSSVWDEIKLKTADFIEEIRNEKK